MPEVSRTGQSQAHNGVKTGKQLVRTLIPADPMQARRLRVLESIKAAQAKANKGKAGR